MLQRTYSLLPENSIHDFKLGAVNICPPLHGIRFSKQAKKFDFYD